MNDTSNLTGEAGVPPSNALPQVTSVTRPFYWSVRREIWENRSIYIAPLAAAALILAGFALGGHRIPEVMSSVMTLPPERQHVILERPWAFTSAAIALVAILVSLFYCLDAFYGERRDRSILFWKSLPVSDLTTLLAKASIPLVILPLIIFVVTTVLQLVMIAVSAAILAAHGMSVAPLWQEINLVQLPLLLLYGLVIFALWYAPVYAYLMLVSAWAKRAPFLWAILPPIGLCVLERLAFGTTYVGQILAGRLSGTLSAAFDTDGLGDAILDSVSQADPIRFMSSPGLWLGLIAACGLFAAVVWMRRNREPI
jgi:ABC-2 type transport system permease protein